MWTYAHMNYMYAVACKKAWIMSLSDYIYIHHVYMTNWSSNMETYRPYRYFDFNYWTILTFPEIGIPPVMPLSCMTSFSYWNPKKYGGIPHLKKAHVSLSWIGTLKWEGHCWRHRKGWRLKLSSRPIATSDGKTSVDISLYKGSWYPWNNIEFPHVYDIIQSYTSIHGHIEESWQSWYISNLEIPHIPDMFCCFMSCNILRVPCCGLPTEPNVVLPSVTNHASSAAWGCNLWVNFSAGRDRLHPGKHLHNYGNSPCWMGESTISMAIFSSYLKLPEGQSQGRVFVDVDVLWV